MRRVTVDRIIAMHPCYSREKVEALWAGRRSLAVAEIAALDIPAQDRAWALVRLLPRRARVAWACDCAWLALPIWRARYPEDRRPQTAIRTVRAWIRGEATIADVRSASSAAAYAAYTCSAAYAAANAAADAAAYASAADTASSAAYAAANAAAADARRASWKWSLARLVQYVEGRRKP